MILKYYFILKEQILVFGGFEFEVFSQEFATNSQEFINSLIGFEFVFVA